MDEERLDISPVFNALTRPAMMMGVTLEYCAASFIFSMCLFIFLGSLPWIGIYFPLHMAGWIGCRFDYNIFNVLFKKMECLGVKNKKLWGCVSYEPF